MLVHKLEVKVANQFRNKKGYLQEADVLSNACAGAVSKLDVVSSAEVRCRATSQTENLLAAMIYSTPWISLRFLAISLV